MQRNKIKRKIYLRIVGTLMATYLVLMTAFSLFLISREKEVNVLQLGTLALQVNNRVEDILGDTTESSGPGRDTAKLKKELAKQISFISYSGAEAALYSGDYSLIYNTNDYWECSYTEYSEGSKNYNGYGYLNPREWFSEEETSELENYLNARPQAEKAGDLAGYSLDLEGLWVDNEMIIPEKIKVVPMYANTFDEEGQLKSSSGTHLKAITYTSDYEQNSKKLPYFKYGGIQPANNRLLDPAEAAGLRELVLDQEKLKEAVRHFPDKDYNFSERVRGLTYHFYWPQPHQNTVKLTDDQGNYSEFWTVFARQVNLWDECRETLVFVWGACLITFLSVALILAGQTYKTYRQREELEQFRRDTASALAHDLKTPLSIISGYAQNLTENVRTEKREHYAAGIQTNVERMDEIIREILELSGLEAGLLPIKSEEVSLQAVCTQVIDRYRQVCAEKLIQISLEGEAVVKADPSLMERVIDNLLVNALDNTPEGGRIGLEISAGTFSLFNSGSHIPEEKIEEIWLPYKKGDESRGRTKGTGLGLAIARTILELFHFSYGAKNTGEGVVFWFKFII
ncbi:sensor histidine kinase [Desulfosporosinus hippei]|uniref:histidine kinase n=1 Tax=Desulfosporosinus hippei DSM 8344 TaxID=1121419 RepID=A0A1G7T6H0_9FIRM|nr:HAMP domain-containing sensor histidine kinase [Desulfosporosinus hippei]SDG30229.1 Histidine kinase-, DNA gyrase B-, and HSP90-like ATPase [Desulfosporosinus hippei DSM 8344]